MGPKRVGKIVKMFNLTKDDDVRDFIVRRKVVTKSGKTIVKKPKIQRLITPAVLARRAFRKKKVIKRRKASAEKRKAYFAMLESRKEQIKKSKDEVEKAVKKKSPKKKRTKK